MSLFAELKRRNVIRVGIAYGITAWLVTQVLEVVLETFGSPEWVMKAVLVILAAGLPFALIFAWAFEMTPEGIKKEKDVDRTQSITPKTGRKLDYAIIGILAIAVVFLLLDRFSPESEDGTTLSTDSTAIPSTESAVIPANAGTSISPSEPPAKSIAVLPFVNMSDDASNEYFSDGISEEILNALARVKDLKVAGRTSSFAFKGEKQDLRQIGEALGVQHILEGSVRKSGNTVRITAQLIQVNDGFHLWSDTYDRELDNVFAIQDEIAQAILTELKATLLGNERIASTQTQTAAYENYLLARQRIYERSESSLQRAIELLDEAIAIDPNYAPAYAQRAIATFLSSDRMYGIIPEMEAKTQGKIFIDQALELDAKQPEALAAKGYYLTEFNLGRAEGIALFQEALAINPNLTDAALWLAMELRLTGELQEAISILKSVYARDPLHRAVKDNLIVSYVTNGQYDEVFALFDPDKAEASGDLNQMSEAAWLKWLDGDLAASLRLNELVYEATPSASVVKRDVGFTLLDLFEPEQALEIDTPGVRILALQRLGRSEEATILGFEQAAGGRLLPELFQVQVENGDHAKLIEFVESRWPDLDGFEALYPERGGLGSPRMGFIAESYAKLGKQAQFNDAMARFKATLDQQVSQGANNAYLHFSQAIYAVLAGDNESAIALLEDVFTHSGGFNINDPKAWPVFAPLNGDPRYEKAKAGLFEHINAERQKLGWEPVSI